LSRNLSFDAKMLMANGVDLSSAEIVDTLLLSGLFVRGEPDNR
jgi:hypothetical protein